VLPHRIMQSTTIRSYDSVGNQEHALRPSSGLWMRHWLSIYQNARTSQEQIILTSIRHFLEPRRSNFCACLSSVWLIEHRLASQEANGNNASRNHIPPFVNGLHSDLI